MRIKVALSMAVAVLAVMTFGLVSPAGGGLPNSVHVVKVVEGPVPAGAVFEIEVDCVEDDDILRSEGGGGSTTLQFDENGDPLGDDLVATGLFTTCTVTETVTNGADVSYACEAEFLIVNGEGEGFEPVECLDDQTVRFDEVLAARGTVTVTNTFADAPPPDIDDDAIADVVTATPAFTG